MASAGGGSVLSSTENELLEFLAAMFSGPIEALEWGAGQALERLATRVHPASQLTIVPPETRIWEPVQGGHQAHLVVIGGDAPEGSVSAGWLLLRGAGVLVLRDGPRAVHTEAELARGAFTIRICRARSAPGSLDNSLGGGGSPVLLACKDPAVGDALTAALRARLGRELHIEPAAPAAGAPAIRVSAPAVRVEPVVASGALRAPSCVFLNTYYPAFMASHYRRQPGLAGASYGEQKRALQARNFGDSDFYSQGLLAAGWQADDLIVNCEPLQRAWAREAGVSGGSLLDIAIEQLRRLRPRVIYLQDLAFAQPDVLARLRPLADLIVGQCGSPVPSEAELGRLDLVFTSMPHYVDRLRAQGVAAYHLPLAFEPRVLAQLPVQDHARRPHAVSFIGGISALHLKGNELLNTVAQQLPLEMWGYGAEQLPPDSPIRQRHRGEAWGDDMFGLLASTRITLNRHGEIAENFASNMRLYEATGCGALLITDYKDNLDQMFEIGKEVVAYRSAEECVALVQFYLAHPDKAAAIAKAGQRRTLREHTYQRRMQEAGDIMHAHLHRKQDQKRLEAIDVDTVSTGYTPIAAQAVTPALTRAWKDQGIPAKQRALVNGELAKMYRGNVIEVLRLLAEVLGPLTDDQTSVLEIGCSSGYYRETLRYLLDRPVAYTGIDYSPAMIAMAKDYYPQGNFLVADGAQLPFPGGAFAVAISSCVILHTPNWKDHLAETVRVARDHVVVHRTPICRQRPTSYQRKQGYGVDMVELVFNEQELMELFAAMQLRPVNKWEYHAKPAADEYGVTYLCSKVAR